MSTQTFQSRVWADLPDPTGDPGEHLTEVVLDADHLRHIANEHVAKSGEPWEELLRSTWLEDLDREELAQRLRRLDRDVVDVFLSCLEWELRRSAAQPRGLLYRSRYHRGDDQKERYVWESILPMGAVLIARTNNRVDWVVRTCFFIGDDFVLLPGRRWREACEVRMRPYVDLKRPSEARLPKGDRSVFVSGGKRPAETRREVRFVVPEQWGFTDSLCGSWTGTFPGWLSEAEWHAQALLDAPHDAEGGGMIDE